MTVRGGGFPASPLAFMPIGRMGPPLRSFAADAHDCIVVRVLGPTAYKVADCHPNCIIVLEAVRMRMARSNQETEPGKNASPCLTQKAPYKGLCADSGEKHEPASDVATVAVNSLKALDPNRPIREALE